MIDLFVTPFCTVLLTAFLTLGIIGPVFSTAESYVLDFAGWIITDSQPVEWENQINAILEYPLLP